MTVRRIRFGLDAQTRLLRGIDILADAVRVTHGPAGRRVLIDGENGPRATRDGASVADSIELDDRFADLGARLMRRAALTVAERAGDGSTTAMVLAQAIAHDGLARAAGGLNPMDLKRGLDLAAAAADRALAAAARPLDGFADIARVAAIAANGDAEIGRLVARAVEKVGRDGVIDVDDGNELASRLDLVRGMRYDQGYISPYFMTDPETQRCELRNPYVLLYGGTLDRHEPLLKLLEASVKARKPLLILADDITGEALQTLVTSKVKGGLRLAAAKAPSFGDRRIAMMEDIAAMTGGTVISEAKGMSLDKATPRDFGRAKRAILTRAETTLVDGQGDPAAIARRVEQIRSQIPDVESNYDTKLLNARAARLSRGIALIRVGGATEAEIAERRQRFDSAVAATRAALAEGILPGGGVALVRAAAAISGGTYDNADQRAGAAILSRALEAPLRRIAENAGANAAAVAEAVRTADDPRIGFDAVTLTCRDMIAAGIVDAALVVRGALAAAVSVGGMLVTVAAVVARDPEPPPLPLDQRPFGPESPDMLPEDLDRYGLR